MKAPNSKPLWHWGKWKSGPTSKRDPTKIKTHWQVSTIQIWSHWSIPTLSSWFKPSGCSHAWPRSLPRETNTGTTKEFPVLNQCWIGCDCPASYWPYHCYKVPYHVPRATGCLSPLWSNIEHWHTCMLLECAVSQECRDKYYATDSLRTLFETIPETCIVESYEKQESSIWNEWSDILYNSSLESPRSDGIC